MSEDWGFPDPVADALAASAVPDPKLARSREEFITNIEHQVHKEAAGIVSDALHFADIDPDDDDPPQAWIDELGVEGARKRLRTAKYALQTPKEAPIGLRIAKDTMVGMSKAKAGKKGPSHVLNMLVVKMTGPVPQYEELEIVEKRK